MKYKRWFRVLVCLVVVCALIVNISPIRAKAVVAETISAIGIAAIFLLMAAGVVFIPKAVEDVQVIGDSLQGFMDAHISTDEEWEEYKNFVDNMNNNFFSDPDADGPSNRDLSIKLSRTLLGLIAGWIGSVIIGIDRLPDAEIPEGMAFYNGVVLPELPEFSCYGSTPYMLLTKSNNYYYLYVTDVAWTAKVDTTWRVGAFHMNGPCHYDVYRSMSSSSAWSQQSCNDVTTDSTSGWVKNSLVWANFDLWNEDTQSVELPGTAVVTHDGELIEPIAVVGDVAEGILNGTHDEDDIKLPAAIDLSGIINSPDTALQDIQSAAQQLADGTITLDEFLEKIQADEETEPEETEATEPEPSESTAPSENPDEDDKTNTDVKPEDPREVGDFALDLTDFFPFCIPFDIFEFLSLLAAEPEAPVFEWAIQVPQLGKTFEVAVDLSPWNNVAALFRKLELMGFILGLAYVTREKYIRG